MAYLAQGIFPEGIDLSQRGKISGHDLINTTKLALNAGIDSVFFNAAFRTIDGSMECTADILVIGTKRTDIYILKSSVSIKTPEYILEAGFKYSVITNSGYNKPINIYIVTLNKDYISNDKFELEELFSITNITSRAKKNRVLIDKYKTKISIAIEKNEIPGKIKNSLCMRPFICNFYDYCWNPNKTRLKSNVKEKGPFIQLSSIKNFIEDLNFESPHYYLDFESFRPAIPIYEGTRPYQNICFQYCVLYFKNELVEPIQKDFYSDASQDPRKRFIISLLKDTEKPGFIMVYNMDFVKSRLKELVDEFPVYSEKLADRIDRLRFLETPFEKPKKNNWGRVKYYTLHAILNSLNRKHKIEPRNYEAHSVSLLNYQEFGKTSIVEAINLKRELQEYCYSNVLNLIEIVKYYQNKTK